MILMLETSSGSEWGVGITRTEHFFSHTGKRLRRLNGEAIAIGEERNTRLQRLIEETKKHPAQAQTFEGSAWRVVQHSYRFSPSDRREVEYTHQLTLQEYENLRPERVELGDFAVVPTKYEEQFDEGYGLRIDMSVLLQGSDIEQLAQRLQQAGYFDVRRPGISDETRRMRFGQTWWSKHPEGNKYNLVLVDEASDKHDPTPFKLGAEHDASARLIALYATLVDKLLAALEQKEVLSAKEIAEFKEAAQAKLWQREHGFFQVEDADNW